MVEYNYHNFWRDFTMSLNHDLFPAPQRLHHRKSSPDNTEQVFIGDGRRSPSQDSGCKRFPLRAVPFVLAQARANDLSSSTVDHLQRTVIVQHRYAPSGVNFHSLFGESLITISQVADHTQGTTSYFSAFLLSATGNTPTAITLQSLSAQSAGGTRTLQVTVFLGAATLLAVSLIVLLARRRQGNEQ